MADNEVELGYNVSQVLSGNADMSRSYEAVSEAIGHTVLQFTKYNEEGEAIVRTTETMLTNGKRIQETFHNTGEAWVLQARKMLGTKASYESTIKQMEAMRREGKSIKQMLLDLGIAYEAGESKRLHLESDKKQVSEVELGEIEKQITRILDEERRKRRLGMLQELRERRAANTELKMLQLQRAEIEKQITEENKRAEQEQFRFIVDQKKKEADVERRASLTSQAQALEARIKIKQILAEGARESLRIQKERAAKEEQIRREAAQRAAESERKALAVRDEGLKQQAIGKQAGAIQRGIGKFAYGEDTNRAVQNVMEQVQAEERAAKEMEFIHKRREKISLDFHLEIERQNAEHFAKQIKMQEVLGDKLVAARRKEAEESRRIRDKEVAEWTIANEKMKQDFLKEQRAKTRALRLELRERLRAEREARQQAQRESEGRQFVADRMSGLDLKRASPNELQKVKDASHQIGRLIAKGEISLKRAQEIMVETANKTGMVYSGVEAKVASVAGRIRAVTAQIGRDWEKANAKAKDTTERASQAIMISWQNVVRFVQFRVVYELLAGIQRGISQSVRDAGDLSIGIAEIQTISQDAALSTREWAKEARILSDTFGEDINQVASGIYETISNQIAKGAEATRFMNQAMEFGAATVTSVEDSVNLLSSALNAYNMQQNQTNRVAAVFFKIIDEGRVKGSELANNYGRIATLGKAVGLTFEETGAAVASMTVNGLKWNEAFTLVNNVMLKLVKPTEDMKALFKTWGVESGEAAIATFGWVETLKKLEIATRGSSAELAELFKDVRAIRGAQGFLDDLQNYEIVLNKLTKSALPEYQKAVEIVMQSSGKQLRIEANKLKNMFTFEFGTPLGEALLGRGGENTWQNIIALMVRVAGAGKGAANAVENLSLAIAGLGITWATARITGTVVAAIQGRITMEMNSQTAAVTRSAAAWRLLGVATRSVGGGSMRLATGATGAAGLAGLAVSALTTGAIAYYMYLERKEQDIRSAYTKTAERLKEAYERRKKIVDAVMTYELEALKRNIDLQFRVRMTDLAKYTSAFQGSVDSQVKKIEEVNKDLAVFFDLQLKAAERRVRALESIIDKARSAADKAADQIRELQRDDAGRLRRNELDAARSESERAKIETRQARELLARAQGLLAKGDVEGSGHAFNEGVRILEQSAQRRLKLEQQIKDAREKLSDLDKAGGSDSQIRREADALEALRRKRAAMAKSRKDSAAIDRQIAAQEDALADARRSKTDSTRQEQKQELQRAIAAAQAELRAIGADPRKTLNAASRDRQALLDQYRESQLKQAAATEKAKAAEEERVKVLQSLLDQIEKLKFPKEAQGNYGEFFKEFDTLAQKIQGLKPSSEMMDRVKALRADYAALAQQNEALFKARAAQEKAIQTRDMQKSMAEQVSGRESEYKEGIQNVSAELEKLGNALTANLKSREALIEERQQAMTNSGGKYAPWESDLRQRVANRAQGEINTINAVEAIKSAVVALRQQSTAREQLEAIKAELSTTKDAARRAELIAEGRKLVPRANIDPALQRKIIEQNMAWLRQFSDQRSGSVIKREDGVNQPLPDFIREMTDQLAKLSTLARERTAIDKAAKVAEQIAKEYAIAVKEADAAQAEIKDSTLRFSLEMEAQSKALRSSFKDLTQSMKEAETLFRSLKTPPKPGGAGNPGAGGVSTGPVNINLYGTSGAVADGRAIKQQLDALARLSGAGANA